jgi:hypothetical protein
MNWYEPANRGWRLGACDSGTANQLNLEVIYKSNRVVPENHSPLSHHLPHARIIR